MRRAEFAALHAEVCSDGFWHVTLLFCRNILSLSGAVELGMICEQ